jgi:hypothetical protein
MVGDKGKGDMENKVAATEDGEGKGEVILRENEIPN